MLAGFPCQPFSIAGVSKKNALGRPHGFACATQGTLFFDVARILAAKRPRAFLLENVKNLLNHDRGRTFRVIRQTLEEELGYRVSWRVIDAAHFLPQHRERILIAGFREDTGFSLDDVALPSAGPKLRAVLHPEDGSEAAEDPYTLGPRSAVNPKYTLTTKLWEYLQAYAAKHRAAGNGFGFGLVGRDDIARTLSARYYKDGSEILVSRGADENPRRLTPRECARLMGFPDSFRIPVSDTQAYKQFGNSVAVPVIATVARAMRPLIVGPSIARRGIPPVRERLPLTTTTETGPALVAAMTDVHTREQRSRNMAAIRSRNTKPEVRVRRVLHAMGFRFRLHRKDLPGRPDIVLPKYQTAIFVHGCFWHCHRCKYGSVVPATRADFWAAKRGGNVARDRRHAAALRRTGLESRVVWECEVRTDEAARAAVRKLRVGR